MADPAKDFVVALDVLLFSAFDALVSTDLLVCLLVWDCAKTLPARVFCSAEAPALRRVLDATELVLLPLCLPFAMSAPLQELIVKSPR
jgi:hypothetical protein